ncbi:MAG: hypothetical protein IH595_09100 [Bacteroidales bacterium]|nr:hypothetical protein [Bacteroidales bacterium]
MKKAGLKFIMLGIVLFISNGVWGQTLAGDQIPSTDTKQGNVLLIDSNHPSFSLSFVTPIAGEAVAPVSNSDLWIILSVGIQNFGHFHNIGYLSAAITSGAVPPGTVLTLVSAPCVTIDGAGTFGTPTAPITLSTTDQQIVTSIGNCYTGTSTGDGYQMTFTLQPDAGNYSQIVAGTYNITVTITLAVNQ